MLDEVELLRKVAKKDKTAFSTLFYLYKNRLFYYFYKLLESYEDAEDLTVETLFRVYRGSGSYKGEGKVSSWIFGIARRVYLEHIKDKNKRIKTVEIYESDAVDERPPINAEVELVKRALEKLAPPG